LLKNEEDILPLQAEMNVAVVGAMAESRTTRVLAAAA